MKKILSCIMTIILAVNLLTGTIVSAKEITNTDTILGIVEQLGIINTEIDEDSSYVTRELAALYIARMLGIDTNEMSDSRYFVDVKNNQFSTTAINALVEKGIISIPENRMFRPGDYVTYDELIKMLVCALGFSDYSEIAGGWMKGYNSIANDLDVTYKVQNQSALTVKEVAALLFRTMCAPVCEYNGVKEGNILYTPKDTFFERYMDIYFEEGLVEEVCGLAMISRPLGTDKNEIVINGEKYDVAEGLDFSKYLGSYVKFFYKEINGDFYEVFYVTDDIQKEAPITISIENFYNFTSTEITYIEGVEDTKLKKIKLSSPGVVYNGEYVGSNISSVFASLNKGTITVKDSDNDRTFDMVFIEDYESGVVSSVNAENGIIYQYDKLPLDLKEYDCVSIYDELGNALDVADIATESVISIMETGEGNYIKIYVSTAQFNGKLGNFDENANSRKYVTIEDYNYYIDADYLPEFEAKTFYGGTFYYKLDYFGQIVDANGSDMSGYLLGYLTGVKFNNDDTIRFTIFTQENEFKKFFLTEKVKIDNRTYKEEKVVPAILEALGMLAEESSVNPQIIRYMINEEGLIDNIDTITLNTSRETDKNSITPVYSSDAVKLFHYAGTTSTRRYGTKVLMNNSTKVFYIPNTFSQEGCYYGNYIVNMAPGLSYAGNAYNFSSDNGYADVVVCKYNSDLLSGNRERQRKVLMIDKIVITMNEYDEVVYSMTAYDSGTKISVEVPITVDISNLSRGDLAYFRYGVDGKIVDGPVVKLYDADEMDSPEQLSLYDGAYLYNANYAANFQAGFGRLGQINGNVLKIYGHGTEEVVNVYDITGRSIAIYDRENDEIITGIENLLDYDKAGNNCSRIMYITGACEFLSAYAYN